jgi:hypothetical protein
MLSPLKRHPDSRGGEALRVEADAHSPEPGLLSLRYVVTGDIAELRLPAAAAPERADELWRHTCFEAFVPAREGAYYEFNFSPSTRWAAYRFDGYRNGMVPVDAVPPPRIEGRLSPGRYDLRATLDLARLPALPRDVAQGLHLAAIVESVGGEISYWAARHCPGKPDFHGFVLPTDL